MPPVNRSLAFIDIKKHTNCFYEDVSLPGAGVHSYMFLCCLTRYGFAPSISFFNLCFNCLIFYLFFSVSL